MSTTTTSVRAPVSPATDTTKPHAAAIKFSALLVTSGFCGISYEVLYGRVLGNLVGNQMAVSSSILMTFLLGIGVGTRYAWRLWRHLWAIEATIGVLGIAFACATSLIDSLLYQAAPLTGSGLGGTVAVCSVLLCPPAFLIGCSLPLFAGYLQRVHAGGGFARAYTLYNFGAALTVLLIEFSLIRALGIQAALISIAVLNLTVAVVLRVGYQHLADQAPPPQDTIPARFSDQSALAIASVGSAIFQLTMVKTAQCIFGPFPEVFALVLAIVLLGVAIGAAAVEKWQIPFTTVMVANLLGVIWLLAGTTLVAGVYADSYESAAETYSGIVLLKFFVLAWLMLVPAISFGATIPAILTSQQHVARESGQLLFVSSVANAVGFLLMAFVLHERFDYGPILVIVAICSAAAMVIGSQRRARSLAIATGLVVLAVVTRHSVWDEDLLYLGHTSFHDREDFEEAREELETLERFRGHQDVFSINWVDGAPYFFINGYTSIPLNSPSEKIVGAFSSIFAPRPDEALVLGVGSGATAGTVGLLFDHTDAVEINPVVLDNLYRMQDYNFGIEYNPRVDIVLDDAIHFTKAGQSRYSLVINTVTTPLYFSSSKLYTREFLRQIRERMYDDGIYVTWVDSRVGDEGLDITLKTIGDTFEYCAIGAIKSAYYLLICSPSPIRAHQPLIVAENDILADYFLREHDLNPEWFRYGLVYRDALELIGDSGTPLNTLDRPALEFSMTRLRERGMPGFQRRLKQALTLDFGADFVPPGVQQDPYELMAHTHMLLGDSSITEGWSNRIAQLETDPLPGFRAAELSLYELRAERFATADAYHQFGYRLMKAGELERAIAADRVALSIDPRRDNTHFNIASCFERLGLLESALEHYRHEQRVDPDDDDVPYRIGRVALGLGRNALALQSLQQAVALSPDSENHVLLGRALEGLGHLEEARDAYRAAAGLSPPDKSAVLEFIRLQNVLDRQRPPATSPQGPNPQVGQRP